MSGLAGSELYPVTLSRVRGARANLSGVQKSKLECFRPGFTHRIKKRSYPYSHEGSLRVWGKRRLGDRTLHLIHHRLERTKLVLTIDILAKFGPSIFPRRMKTNIESALVRSLSYFTTAPQRTDRYMMRQIHNELTRFYFPMTFGDEPLAKWFGWRSHGFCCIRFTEVSP
jgi:hypothetical protein